MNPLHADRVSVTYRGGIEALAEVSLSIAPGEVVFLLGKNGSGKSTLLRCLAGVLRPTTGRVTLADADLATLAADRRARQIALIPQMSAPIFSYSVETVVMMGRAPHLTLFGTPGAADRTATEAALAAVGLRELADRPFATLSGGQQQLALIARGLAAHASYLLMDEPDAHLDPGNQHRIYEVVRALAAGGTAFVIASHTPAHALDHADRVVLLGDGRALAIAPPAESLTEPLLSAAYGVPMRLLYDPQSGAARAACVAG